MACSRANFTFTFNVINEVSPVCETDGLLIIIIIIIILFDLSSFTISEANYRLTLGYHGIASFIYNYISSTLVNHFFLTISKYFPAFCMSVLFVRLHSATAELRLAALTCMTAISAVSTKTVLQSPLSLARKS